MPIGPDLPWLSSVAPEFTVCGSASESVRLSACVCVSVSVHVYVCVCVWADM